MREEMSEAEAMEDIGWCTDEGEPDNRLALLRSQQQANRDQKIARYNKAAAAQQGDKVMCPTCCRQFIKMYYSQRFCGLSNKGGTLHKSHQCKDRYHNSVGRK